MFKRSHYPPFRTASQAMVPDGGPLPRPIFRPLPASRADFLPPGGLAPARPPQRQRHADGLDRRAGHPVPALRGQHLLRAGTRRGGDQGRAAAVPVRAAVGPPRPAPAHPPGPRARDTAAGLPVGAHRPGAGRAARAGGRGLPGHGGCRARGGPVREPRHRRRRMPTLRAEFHRIAPGASTAPRKETGSSVSVDGGLLEELAQETELTLPPEQRPGKESTLVHPRPSATGTHLKASVSAGRTRAQARDVTGAMRRSDPRAWGSTSSSGKGSSSYVQRN